MSRLRFTTTSSAAGVRIALAGGLAGDLTAPFQKIAAAVRGPKVVFDLGGVEQIASDGVPQWVALLRAIPHPIELDGCSVAFVDYANMIAAILGKASVASFAVPLVCKGCGKEAETVVAAAAARGAAEPAWDACTACGAAQVPEIEWGDYLSFLRPAKKA